MNRNRSIPNAAIIPELGYPDVAAAAAWLCDAFAFAERLRIGSHRAQLTFGGGAIVVTERAGGASTEPGGDHSVMVRVDDADAHCARATEHGARIIRPPTDHPFGERQYTAVDPGGHVWTFTQTIADVHPRDWGGDLRQEAAETS
jgi:uncharacterized glyoxalase superfamily protein PhnB